MTAGFVQVLRDQFNLLFFRPFKPNLRDDWRAYLAWGLFATWITGIGRYWDHPSAQTWQYLGLGSLGYVFVLACLIWAIVAPLKPKHWSYLNVLIFVTLTSLPALLYAIPVERFMSLKSAQTANVWFLALVAAWRVALLFRFIRKVAGLDLLATCVAGLLPLVLIVTALTTLNLEQAVFEIMSSSRSPTSNDEAYAVLFLITALSMITSPVLVISYAFLVFLRRKPKNSAT